ncbi:hypothetical protein EOW65_06475 [Sinirhodobacter ferrireducens]|uniref:Uncharacterized protein n=1 Tax=Paenirhodobacter ferrireducens TaxID=1215032 RepID=A0A443LN19_9RHOB|nr:hypothetical protein [Sinirhodobacter ferrireducens]RWR50597.1 hypothetical protein EOW65_06475 [Sinirhodobacter ferrireducens]
MTIIKGRVSGAISAFHSGDLRKRLSMFGDDILGLWVPQPGVSFSAGVALGSAVPGVFSSAIGRRDRLGMRAYGAARGATYRVVDGLMAMDCSTGSANFKTTPTSTASFGLGLILHLDAACLTAARTIAGNGEQGGGYFSHALTRSYGGAVDGFVGWQGVSSTYLRDTADVYTRKDCTITKPGWYVFSLDRNNGLNGMAINGGRVAVNTAGTTPPTMTSTYVGSNSSAVGAPGTVSMAALFACNGPLAQSADRLAQWRDLAAAIQRDLTVSG